jgi:hypothetical protein
MADLPWSWSLPMVLSISDAACRASFIDDEAVPASDEIARSIE